VGAAASAKTNQKHSFLVGKQPDLTNNLSDDINLTTLNAN